MDSDNIDDPGRKDSEQRLKKNTMSSKYLEEVIEKTGMEYEEAVEAIEREKKGRDAIQDGTASTYGIDLHTQVIDGYARRNFSLPSRPKPAASERQDFEKGRQDDKERVKGLLGAGKHVSEGEMGVVQAPGAEKEAEGGRAKEIFAQARKDSGVDGAKALKQVQKGVKKMTKGLE